MMCFYLLCLFVLGVSAAGSNEEDAWARWALPHDDAPCTTPRCFDRETRDDISGPFWGNRGKRLPSYKQHILYAEEPQFVIVRGGNVQEGVVEDTPFFHTRGRKSEQPPFFTARGKRTKF